MTISYPAYTKLLCILVLSTSLVLGVILGIALLLVGETTMNFNIGLDLGTFDGLWYMMGVPAASVLIALLLSPLSFLIYRPFAGSEDEDQAVSPAQEEQSH